MLVKFKENKIINLIKGKATFGLLLLFGLIVPTFGQTVENTPMATVQTADKKSEKTVLMPIMTEYKGIKIGAAAEEVRDKLGKAKIDDKDGFFYDEDDEMVQIRLDADKKVRFIAVTFTKKIEKALKFTDVFGAEASVPTQSDGSIYNLVRYPEAGYWVAYSRTSGENPMVTVSMQKL